MSSPTKAASKSKEQSNKEAIKKQVEFYLSDVNLGSDQFFRQKIQQGADGWIDAQLILNCNKIKTLGATTAAITEAVADSDHVETKGEADTAQIRRKDNKALPAAIETHQTRGNKKAMSHAHDGGVVIKISGLPAGMEWKQVADVVKEAIPGEGDKITFCERLEEGVTSTVTVLKPFDGDFDFCYGGELEKCIQKAKPSWTVSVIFGTDLLEALKKLPPMIVRKRSQRAKERVQSRNRPILLAEQKYPNVKTAMQRVREILANRKLNAEIPNSSGDYRLVEACLRYHPNSEKKMADMKAIEIRESPYGVSRCFFIARTDGESEDISFIKAFQNMEANPPYADADGSKKETDATATVPKSPSKRPADASPKSESPKKAKTE